MTGEPNPEVAAAPTGQLAVFGAYSDHDLYQRNRVLVDLLESQCGSGAGFAAPVRIRPPVVEGGHAFSARQSLLQRAARLWGNARSLYSQRNLLASASVIFVPYPAYLDLLLLAVCPRQPSSRVIADAFLELKSTVVDDRKLLPAGSLRSRALRMFQRYTLARADVVLIDTESQAALLRKELAGTGTDVVAVPVGIDEEQWRALAPRPPGDRCRVLFWGTFIPLHGVEHILAAAQLLAKRGQGYEFRICGDGQMADAAAERLAATPLPNVRWERRLLSTEELRSELDEADIVLGVFGATEKAGAVIPYKVHQALASNRPVITRSGPAVAAHEDRARGLFTVPAGDSQRLAQQIVDVWAQLQSGWRPDTQSIYREAFSQRQIAARLREVLAR